ncbi:Holliday junction resolvase RuvX [Quadrisphaera oryzae]|uniref:Holliday junction resolvase RuvX n=1 Tax=Quadrisphaera TaxID=317661 RepID=UPI001648F1B3|nr:Holliday junction resolvase RuvX [Quadrisphaera sp. RL12-1S]
MRDGVRLGVDVGSVRVGLAVCDPSGSIASPVETLKRDRTQRSDLRRIAAEIAERDALEVVIGLPVSLSGREGPAAAAVRDYAADLAGMVAPVPVRLVDERLSTVSAHQALTASGRSGRRHREVVDQVAAVLILQTALDAERATGRPPGSTVDPGPAPG